ncbi:MAG: ComF family protein [Clostridia bacterium]|nr:ComF family protein [Clostridia bacterium]
MNKFVKAVLDLLFPPKCAVCGELSEGRGALCDECFGKYREEYLGAVGARTFGGNLRMIALTEYHPSRADTHVTERAILKLKRVKRADLADLFARDMARAVLRDIKLGGHSTEDVVLTYIPRGEGNLRKYGFDHGELLCRRISLYSGLSMIRTFERKRGGEQKKMTASERTVNAEESLFGTDTAKVRGLHVYLVDDVITSGAGAKRCSELLYKMGCADVTGLFIAETVRHDRRGSY